MSRTSFLVRGVSPLVSASKAGRRRRGDMPMPILMLMLISTDADGLNSLISMGATNAEMVFKKNYHFE